MNKNIKLIFVGTEDVSSRIEISKEFIKLGYKIEIIGTEKKDKFKQNNIIYQKYFLNRELNIFRDLKTILELRSILKKQKEGTVIHAFDTKPTMYIPIATLGLKDIYIGRTITGMGRIFTEKNFKNSILKFIYNLIQKIISYKIDFTIFQNEDDYNYYIANNLIKKEKAFIVKSSGLNIKKFVSNISEDKIKELKRELHLKDTKTFILVSRMVKQKGILNYLKAAKMCYENGYKYNFLLVGQLDTDNSITIKDIKQYQDYVQYLGRREDIKELLSISDIFVLPTYYREGVPRVLLEASALGLALIATDMPGCKDVVIDEYNGKLVKPKDSKDLYEKMIYVAESEKMKFYGENAKEKVKEFDLSIIVQKYDEIYKKLKG